MSADGRSALTRRVVAAFTEHLPLKVTALFFSVFLWLLVSAEEPAERTVPVQVHMIPSDTSVELRESVTAVRALVVGPQRELLKLAVTPPVIHRRVGPDYPDTLRLTPADVELGDVQARVRAVTPSRLVVRSAQRAGRDTARPGETLPTVEDEPEPGAVPLPPSTPPIRLDTLLPRPRRDTIPARDVLDTTVLKEAADRIREQLEAARDSLRAVTRRRADSLRLPLPPLDTTRRRPRPAAP